MRFQHILCVVFIIFLTTSCEKQDVASEYQQKWLECRKNNSIDQQAIFNQLMGEWKMIATNCAECSSPGIKATAKNVKLIFTTDSTVSVFEDGQLIKSSKIAIKPNHSYIQTYSIETDPLSDNLYTWAT